MSMRFTADFSNKQQFIIKVIIKRLDVLRGSSCSKCLLLYGPFRHGALELDHIYIVSNMFCFVHLCTLYLNLYYQTVLKDVAMLV